MQLFSRKIVGPVGEIDQANEKFKQKFWCPVFVKPNHFEKINRKLSWPRYVLSENNVVYELSETFSAGLSAVMDASSGVAIYDSGLLFKWVGLRTPLHANYGNITSEWGREGPGVEYRLQKTLLNGVRLSDSVKSILLRISLKQSYETERSSHLLANYLLWVMVYISTINMKQKLDNRK